jgi:hypothetical protein
MAKDSPEEARAVTRDLLLLKYWDRMVMVGRKARQYPRPGHITKPQTPVIVYTQSGNHMSNMKPKPHENTDYRSTLSSRSCQVTFTK